MQLPLFRFFFFLFVVAFAAPTSSADTGECKERRQRASKAFSAGILLLHSKTIDLRRVAGARAIS